MEIFMKRIILYAYLTVALIACHKNNETSNSTNFFKPQNSSIIIQKLKDASLTCRDENNCPQNVGMIFSNANDETLSPKISQCTGFLIAKNIVATNSHCIPNRFKQNTQIDCSESLAIRFSKNDASGNSIYSCKKIINFSENIKLLDPDFAFFEIQETQRDPLSISKSGIKNNQSAIVFKITPRSDTTGGTLESEACRIVMGSLLNPEANDSFSKTGLAVDCEGVHGNSGSPVLNNTGQVIGILQSHFTDNYNDALTQNFGKFGLKLPPQITKHFHFTNLSCVEDPISHSVDSQNCSRAAKLSLHDCLKFDKNDIDQQARDIHESFKQQRTKIFLYETTTDISTKTISSRPICVIPPSILGDKTYTAYVQKKGIFGFRKEIIYLPSLPNYYYFQSKLSLDPDYRIDEKVKFSIGDFSSNQIELVNTDGLWKGKIIYSLSKIQLPVEIPFCTQEQTEKKELSVVRLKDGKTISEEEYLQSQKNVEAKNQCLN